MLCDNCGHRLEDDNIFCDVCGHKIETKTNFRREKTDDELIGSIIQKINNVGSISRKDIIKITSNTDKADRIIARLENLEFFRIEKKKNDIYVIRSQDQYANNRPNQVSGKEGELRRFLDIGPISLEALPGMMGITSEQAQLLVRTILKDRRYMVLQNCDKEFLTKRN